MVDAHPLQLPATSRQIAAPITRAPGLIALEALPVQEGPHVTKLRE